MANRHSLMWRAPGRRNLEREKFRRLMAQVERIRQRDGLTKRQVCDEIGTNKSGLHDWLAGEVIARKESIAKIKAFLAKRSGV